MNKRLVDIILIFATIFLFVFSSLIPMVFGYKQEVSERDLLLEQLEFVCKDSCGYSRFEYYKEIALEYAFMLDQLGVRK